jgi:hypothetical protein
MGYNYSNGKVTVRCARKYAETTPSLPQCRKAVRSTNTHSARVLGTVMFRLWLNASNTHMRALWAFILENPKETIRLERDNMDKIDELLGIPHHTPAAPNWRPRKRDRPCCGARTRANRPCQAPAVADGLRCRMHGGASTGPRTEQGKAAVSAAQKARWAKWREERGRA